jgi:plasmid stabilization system protein ParE
MRIEWTYLADRQRDQVANYIRKQFGAKRMKVFLKEVRSTTKMLSSNPNIGPIDPLFEDRPIAYRYVIINNLSKLVYYIDDDVIYIAAFWDTRREPKKQAEQVK